MASRKPKARVVKTQTSVHVDTRRKSHAIPDKQCFRDVTGEVADHLSDITRSRRQHLARRKRIREATQNTADHQEDEPSEERKETVLQQWRRMARLVRILCAVCIALRKYAMEAGLLENYMVSVMTRTTTRGGADGALEELTFNLDDFKIRKELAVPPQLVAVLEKRPEWRTKAEILAVSRMMRSLPSFRKYTTEMQLLMSKIVRYMKCGRRRVVLRKGHIGYSVYFVYSGSVSVVMDTDEQSVFVKPETVILRKGACFGEIAMSQNSRRSATVVCAEEVEFLVIDKDEFVENGLHQRTQEEYTRREAFLRSWPPLQDWPAERVSELSSMSRTEDFNHNKVVVKDGRNNEWMWFVIKGSCEVLRLVDLRNSPDYERLVELHSYTSKPPSYTRTKDTSTETPEQTKSFNRANRAKSAPHSKTATLSSRKIQHHGRPQTCLGFARDKVIREEDEFEIDDGPNGDASSALVTQMEHKYPALDGGDGESTASKTWDSVIKDAMERKNELNHKTSNRDIPTQSAMFVRVDTLRDGMCFGLEALFDDSSDIQPCLSLVSQGCTVIHFPRTQFREMIDREGLAKVRSYLKTYPTDSELCSRFLYKSEWDNYKNMVVESVISNIQNNVTFGNSMRNCQQSEYNARFDTDRMTRQFYVPLTAKTKSQLMGSYSVNQQDADKIQSKGLRAAIESRRPRSAWQAPQTEYEKRLDMESKRNSNIMDRPKLTGNLGKHRAWTNRMKDYTTPRSRPASARPHSARSPDKDVYNKKTDKHVIAVKTSPVVIDQNKKHQPLLAQPARC